jgi:cytochrome c-type biogenesis protein CcmF
MDIGPYTLVCQSFTQDDKANSFSEWAILDVYKGGKKIDTMTPVREFFKASQQASTKPDIRSTFKEDLYLVYEGQNEKSQPIIKAHLNPLVMWIWLGVWIMLAGTLLCLVPNAPAPVRVQARSLVEAAPVAGD